MARKSSSSTSAAPADGLTPAMRQYVEQKAQVPDALLLFRMGDFYELFYEDAETASRVLGLTLTSRSKGDSAIPLAGIPYHALESYLTKLVHAGFKVAISEQVEDPRQAKGIVRREVVRIVTPGTLTEDNLLQGKADNYLAGVCFRGEQMGLAFVELSTGAFAAQLVTEQGLLDELARLGPAELLLPEARIDARDALAAMAEMLRGPGSPVPGLTITRRPAHLFETFQAEQILKKHFGVATLEGFGFQAMDASLCAAAAILDYLNETQKTSLQHITRLARRTTEEYVGIDQSTWRALEIERTIRSGTSAGSLVEAVDRTSTAMGARCLKRWLAEPLRRAEAIHERQEAVAALLSDRPNLQILRAQLRQLADIERITARLGVNRASPRDLLSLGRTLLAVDQICELMSHAFTEPRLPIGDQQSAIDDQQQRAAGLSPRGANTSANPAPPTNAVNARHSAPSDRSDLPPFLRERCTALSGLRELGDYLTTALHPDAPLTLNDGGIIAPGFDAELDRLRSISTDGRQWLAEFQAREIQRTGIPTLKVGFNQVFGYYIEITHLHRDRVPSDYVRKQTIKNAERYITDELKKHETEVLTARDRANLLEAELFERIRRHTAERIPALLDLARAVAEIDVTAGWAALADERRYVRPEIVNEPVLEIEDGRHPVLEQSLAEKFVPNDCYLTAGEGLPATAGGQQSAVSNKEPRVSARAAAAGGQRQKAAGFSPRGSDDRRPAGSHEPSAADGPGLFATAGLDTGSPAGHGGTTPGNLKSESSNLKSEISNSKSEISNSEFEISNLRSESLAILTGPNMAGKSTYIRQVALLTLLAQTGCFVPAGRMRLKPADRIFARIGASDEITRGQSTFMVEMTEAANILNNATRDSLVIIDELGRGTSTFDGLSLAWGIAEHLVTRTGCRCLFATHYHELTQLEQYMSGVVNYNVAVREWQEEIVFLHRIVRGATDRSYGVHVAKLAGIPPEVIRRSRDILAELESNFSATRRAPARAARRTRKDTLIQPLLFADPADEVIEEIEKLDIALLTPEQALNAVTLWRKRLKR